MLYSLFMMENGSFDLLSSLMARLELESSVAGAFNAKGDYSVEIAEYIGLKLHLILKGEFWLAVEGESAVQHVCEGDCVLLPSGRSAKISKTPNSKKTIHIQTLQSKAENGVMTLNGGGEFFGIGLHFNFSGHFPKLLFSRLPSVIHVPSQNAQSAALRWNIERFRTEYMERNLGRAMILAHLAPIILLQILRSYVESGARDKNWLFALSDPRLARAIEAMHKEAVHSWSVDSLAEIANMSRSGFVLSFKRHVGLSPIEYLTHWRIHLACQLLTSGGFGVAQTAEAVGFKSESGFSAAFKHIMKCRPGSYARQYRVR